MALNCIVVSETGAVPIQIHAYLAHARFFELRGVATDLARAEKMAQSEEIHYFLMDQETARKSFTALLAVKARQILIFGAEEVFALENLKEDLAALFTNADDPELAVNPREAGTVEFGMEARLIREIKSESPANKPVNITVKAGKAQFISKRPENSSRAIFVRSDSRISRIKLEDLLYVEAERDYVIFHTAETSFRTLNSMKKIERHLSGDEFFRIHRSFIVRLDKIHTVQGDEVLLDGPKDPVPIGPSFKNKLMKRLELL